LANTDIPYYITVLKAFFLVTSGMLLLRISGRKSISQMTVVQTIIMISIGNIIIQPIATERMERTLIASSIFILTLILVELLQTKYNFIEKFFTGESILVIKDGHIIPQNLKKLRFTVDQLEMRLRQNGISSISDVKVGTLEPNGQLGYELMRHAKPVTIGELEKLLSNVIVQPQPEGPEQPNAFDEVVQGCHKDSIPKHLE
jgi:uncharacterized membrane protein YcaP (DUF421 family)